MYLTTYMYTCTIVYFGFGLEHGSIVHSGSQWACNDLAMAPEPFGHMMLIGLDQLDILRII